ncbi:glycosyltransferase [Myxococcota bacterium]|nr:glycosyltransferase [Myxococcota bacterium]
MPRAPLRLIEGTSEPPSTHETQLQRSPHIALVGAFPFPLSQGSQIFARDQALALRAAGARITVLCYGSGEAGTVDLSVLRTSPRSAPRALQSGPALAKPLADAALLRLLISSHRRLRFDAILAHNAEAACVGLAARPWIRVPVIYVAHTLLGQELSRYAKRASQRTACWLDGAGHRIDAWLARHADQVITLDEIPRRRLSAHAHGEVSVVPPGFTPGPTPETGEIRQVCSRHQLTPGRFALYTGNLDGYQDLGDLADAARASPNLNIVVATHAPADTIAAFEKENGRSLRVLRMSPAEARTLTHAAGVAVLPRRRPGGFPVKLLNYMEAARAIVARTGVADGLEHGLSACLLDASDPPSRMGAQLRNLLAREGDAARLGRGARRQLESRHAWPEIAARTLEVIERAIGSTDSWQLPARLPSPRGGGKPADRPGAVN